MRLAIIAALAAAPAFAGGLNTPWAVDLVRSMDDLPPLPEA